MRARFVTDTASVNVNPKQVEGKVQVKSASEGGSVKVKSTEIITEHERLSGRYLENQHPIDAITGLREALARADTFVYEQGIASASWEITHNLDKRPSVTVVDSAGSVITPAVTYIDNNTCLVEINGATTGYAYLN